MGFIILLTGITVVIVGINSPLLVMLGLIQCFIAISMGIVFISSNWLSVSKRRRLFSKFEVLKTRDRQENSGRLHDTDLVHQHLFLQSPLGIAEIDQSGKLIKINPIFAKLLGQDWQIFSQQIETSGTEKTLPLQNQSNQLFQNWIDNDESRGFFLNNLHQLDLSIKENKINTSRKSQQANNQSNAQSKKQSKVQSKTQAINRAETAEMVATAQSRYSNQNQESSYELVLKTEPKIIVRYSLVPIDSFAEGTGLSSSFSSEGVTISEQVHNSANHAAMSQSMPQSYFLLYLNEITAYKDLENQMLQARKMQAIGQLAGGIAHDFNNLLTAMIGFCDLLLARHPAGDESFSDIMQIQQNAMRAAGLVRQLLAFSRQQRLLPRVLVLGQVLTELSYLLQRLIGQSIDYRLLIDPELGLVKVDQGQFEQVIINLVVNARDAMVEKSGGAGGVLTIRATNKTIHFPINFAHESMPPGNYIQIDVIDNGIGIPESVIERIFDPFFTTKPVGSGTGLGLSTVWGIVRQTDGFVTVTSELGRGSAFTIYLPRVMEGSSELLPENQQRGHLSESHTVKSQIGSDLEETQSQEQSQSQSPDAQMPSSYQFNRATELQPNSPTLQENSTPKPNTTMASANRHQKLIILVEDEEAVRIFISRSLRNHGYLVYDEASGEEALNRIKTLSMPLDLLITDAVMPIMDGPKLIQLVRQNRPSVRVICISGHTDESLRHRLNNFGDVRFLAKPFTLKELVDTVGEILGS